MSRIKSSFSSPDTRWGKKTKPSSKIKRLKPMAHRCYFSSLLSIILNLEGFRKTCTNLCGRQTLVKSFNFSRKFCFCKLSSCGVRDCPATCWKLRIKPTPPHTVIAYTVVVISWVFLESKTRDGRFFLVPSYSYQQTRVNSLLLSRLIRSQRKKQTSWRSCQVLVYILSYVQRDQLYYLSLKWQDDSHFSRQEQRPRHLICNFCFKAPQRLNMQSKILL